jgi:cofilin
MKEIIVEEKGDKDAQYSELYNKFQHEYAKEPKYVVVDHSYEVDGKREKIVFINWIPESSQVKKKMIFASSKSTLKQKFEGIHFEIQGTDLSEVVEEKLTEKALMLNKN